MILTFSKYFFKNNHPNATMATLLQVECVILSSKKNHISKSRI